MAEEKAKRDAEGNGTYANGNFTEKGKFAKGNTASKGHKQREQVRANEFKRIFQEAISFEDMKAVAEAMLTKAKGGDVKAAKEVLDRCMGKAPQAVKLEGEVNLNMMGLLELIDGSSKGQLPDSQEGKDAG